MRAALVLHLFDSDEAISLIDRVARLAMPIDVIVTHSAPLEAGVRAALGRLRQPVRILPVVNRGSDVGPLFEVLPHLARDGYELIGKLHANKGASGFGPAWRQIAHDGMIASDALVAAILDAFAQRDDLAMLGPKALYQSVAKQLWNDGGHLSAMAPRLMAPAYPPSDWGFFAGRFFWARRTILERLAPVAAFDDDGTTEPEGGEAHALERLFGLAPVAAAGAIGLVADGAIEIVRAPGEPSRDPLVEAFAQAAPRLLGPVDDALSARIAETNPLLHYIAHGRDADALDPNPYFSSAWYNRVHADVRAAAVHPLVHYVRWGATEGRATGPLFDGRLYRSRYPDVGGSDPLRHLLEKGLAEGRTGAPGARQPQEAAPGGDRRFDAARELAFLAGIAALPAAVTDRARTTLVSVVMAVRDRADRVGAAIRSVLAQSHDRLELIVVDDGSTDGTPAVVEAFTGDPRLRLIVTAPQGVGAARNVGLAAARGDLIAYLDADNRWVSWFLEVMTRFMVAQGLDVAYAAIALRDGSGALTGYHGADFDRDACLKANYVDLNAFCHSRAPWVEHGGFDPHIRRMIDWDLILRYSRGRPVGYAPFVGCDYHADPQDLRRITLSEPSAFHAVVRTKNVLDVPAGPDAHALAAALRLSFAIKIAAPAGETAVWGDFHFAEALAAALRRLGHAARVDMREAWQGHAPSTEDVVIVLRGLIEYEPPRGRICFLWNISHPDQVDYREFERFHRVYAASASHAALLGHILRVPVAVLQQATDPARFRPDAATGDAPDILFVGNARGAERDIVRWAIAADRPPAIFGGGWEGRVPPALVAGEVIDNARLGGLYASAGVVLNDHWPSMRAFGILSNRLFDIVASGGRAISDAVPSLAATFGDAVRTVDGPAALRDAVDVLLAAPRAPTRAAAHVHAEHSFDARARTIVADAFAILGLPAPAPRPAPADTRLSVHVIAHHGPAGPQSSAFIRLLAPLTDDTVAARVRVTIGPADDPIPACDVCIVQRTALATVEAADALIAALDARGVPLLVDIDDAFVLIGPDHPEADIYGPRAAALDRLVSAAAETWVSTPALATLHGERCLVVPNAVDPRLWRDWRAPAPARFSGPRLRLLYMGTYTHGADLDLIRPALDALAAERPGAFDLTIVGIAPDFAPAPWLHRLSPPADAVAYPRFVRWLRAQGPFDLGLAPLVDTPFNRAKSDIKALDYGALGILPLVADMPGYRADPALAALTLFAGQDPATWLAALRRVLNEPAYAAARAAAVREHVWRHRSVAGVAGQLLARLESLGARRRREDQPAACDGSASAAQCSTQSAQSTSLSAESSAISPS